MSVFGLNIKIKMENGSKMLLEMQLNGGVDLYKTI
jgi:hypothetical protein